MRNLVRFEQGKDHYVDATAEGKYETTVCGLVLDDRKFYAVASEEFDLDNLCKRCYNASVRTVAGTSRVLEVSDEPIFPEESE